MENNQDEPQVLIARNNETGQVGAVVGQNPDGSPQMADVKSAKLSDLVKFSKGQNPLEAFMSNFLRQAKNPSTFGLFKIPAAQYDTVGHVTADLANDAEANKEMLAPYAVKASDYKVRQEQTQEQKTPEHEEQPKNPKVDPDKVDWNRIQKEWGITRDDLEKSGNLNDMLYNRKSPKVVTLSPVIDGEKLELQARLAFRHNPDGSVTLSPHPVKLHPQLDQTYKGYEFTMEDKAALLKNGALANPVELTDPKTGQKVMSLVMLDRLTNEIESVPHGEVYIKGKVCDLDLTMKEIMVLKNGGIVPNKNITAKDGRQFNVDLQYSIDKGEVHFIRMRQFTEEQNLEKSSASKVENKPDGSMKQEKPKFSFTDAEGNPKRLTQWRKIPMNEQQQNDYLAGKLVEVGLGKDKAGQDCTVYLQWNKETRWPKTGYKYPGQAKIVGIGNESKVQVAVNNEGKTNEATKNIKEPLQKGQTQPKDDTQTKQQRKPKGPKM